MKKNYILWFDQIRYKNLLEVGGKNASLGEMYSQLAKKGINIPYGFALTSDAYWYFLKYNQIDKNLKKIFQRFNPRKIDELQKIGQKSRLLFEKGKFPSDLEKQLIDAYQKLSQKYNQKNTDVAVRSSGIAEDQPTMSFAGQFESFLNISGSKNLLKTIKKCFASTFNDRVIAYREQKYISHLKFALSIGIQKMVRSDLACSGVMFTLDTETGFEKIVLINAIWGLGELIVKGRITPDTFYVFKPTLRQGYSAIIRKDLGRKTIKYVYKKRGGIKEKKVAPKDQLRFCLNDQEILTLAKWGILIENHYSLLQKQWMPQDIEWAKDGKTGQLFVVQARPETVHSTRKSQIAQYKEYKIETKKSPLLEGIAIGNKIAQGKVRIIEDISKISQFKKGEILVTKMTDPDWTSLMGMASGIITDEGGKTCHSAIIARELGIPAIVGTAKATKVLKNGQEITIDCSQGLRGRIFDGFVPFKEKTYKLLKKPKLKTKIMVNIGAPEIAFHISFLPTDGVGLAREEFIIAEKIRVHPLALYHFEKLKKSNDQRIKEIVKKIEQITSEHKDKTQHFIKELAEGVAQIACAFWPRPVIVRFSDFKTNEYKNLVGGEIFEGEESNPMLGFRGASRYLDKEFQPAFRMECEAIKRARDIFGLKNIWVMIPFCRTVQEGKEVLKLMEKYGLKKGKDGLKVIVMCEIPSNVLLAKEFLKIFDGFSIGSNDLTQLVLGLDRDNAKIARVGDERNEAVKKLIKEAIKICRQMKKYSGICGQAPSDFEDFAWFLIKEGIESISLNPDSVIPFLISKK